MCFLITQTKELPRLLQTFYQLLTIILFGVLKERMLKWFAIPFSSGPGFVRTLHPDAIRLGWLIALLSYTRLWSMWSFWLVFCDGGFHSVGHGIKVLIFSVCPLMNEDKRLVQDSWWEGLTVGKTGSCSGGHLRVKKLAFKTQLSKN